MLYSNQTLKATERKFDFGIIHQIGMGEHGRGRKFMALTCPENSIIKKGLNQDYTIGKTKSGKPKVIKKFDETLYMLLSAEGDYTRRGNGTIMVLANQKDKFEVLSRGNGADGEAGRIGFWVCMLLQVPNTDAIIRVRTSGAGYGTPSDLYVIHHGNVYHCHITELEECCESLGTEVPCKIVNTEDGLHFGKDWIIL